ncbi:hypothetical protein E2C01_027402 [Portunus trituberculatus]|uniref:Uncharacterized protein n=1 Tax=Portunus trituberculatus TaxID=210409 RepID=A0A5B7ELJ0_PORTR|nr:hypothetical protein [Portunus trituberculatus]
MKQEAASLKDGVTQSAKCQCLCVPPSPMEMFLFVVVSIVCAAQETHELRLRDTAAATLHCCTAWRTSLLRAGS